MVFFETSALVKIYSAADTPHNTLLVAISFKKIPRGNIFETSTVRAKFTPQALLRTQNHESGTRSFKIKNVPRGNHCGVNCACGVFFVQFYSTPSAMKQCVVVCFGPLPPCPCTTFVFATGMDIIFLYQCFCTPLASF